MPPWVRHKSIRDPTRPLCASRPCDTWATVTKARSVPRADLRLPAALAVGLTLASALITSAALPISAAGPYLEGIDVSRWQGEPTWSQVKEAGIRFVIAKATEGSDWVDPEFARNRERLRANGIPFSAYHFAQPDTTTGDAVAEADHFVDTARLDGPNLLPVLDLERDGALSTRQLTRWVKAWLTRVEARLGVKPMIYTSSDFWIEQMGNSRWFADNGYRLWIAHWDVPAPAVPAGNWGGRGWTLWQYDVRGGLDGISGKVDRDRYNGADLAPIRIRTNR